MSRRYAVDIPNCYDLTGAWTNVEWFDTRKEAVDFVQKTFCGDDEGCISLITEHGEIDDEEMVYDEEELDALAEEKALQDAIKQSYYDDETVLDEEEGDDE